MAKALLVLLLIVLAAVGALYWWLYRPHEEAMEAARQQAAADVREIASLRGRVADLESIRDQLQRTSTELQEKVAEKEKELASLRSTQDELQGHTDNNPIRGALTKRFATNWELSAARAINVARFLQDEGGVAPAMLSASGYSEYRPKASNDTDEGRRQNRRIEILLGPLLPVRKAEAR